MEVDGGIIDGFFNGFVAPLFRTRSMGCKCVTQRFMLPYFLVRQHYSAPSVIDSAVAEGHQLVEMGKCTRPSPDSPAIGRCDLC